MYIDTCIKFLVVVGGSEGRMSHLQQLFQALHYSFHWFPIISLMYLLIPLFAHLHKLLRSWNRLQGLYSSEYNLLQHTCNKYNETLHVLLVLPLKSHPLLDTKRHYNYAKYLECHFNNIILHANSSKYFSICTNSVPFEPPGMTKTNNILPTSMQFQAQGICDTKNTTLRITFHLTPNPQVYPTWRIKKPFVT